MEPRVTSVMSAKKQKEKHMGSSPKIQDVGAPIGSGIHNVPLPLSEDHGSLGFLHWAADELSSNSNTAASCLLVESFPSCLCAAQRRLLLKNMQGLQEAVIVPL